MNCVSFVAHVFLGTTVAPFMTLRGCASLRARSLNAEFDAELTAALAGRPAPLARKPPSKPSRHLQKLR